MTGFLTAFEMTFYILERESVFEAAKPPQKHSHFSCEMPVISSAARNLINKHVIGNAARNLINKHVIGNAVRNPINKHVIGNAVRNPINKPVIGSSEATEESIIC